MNASLLFLLFVCLDKDELIKEFSADKIKMRGCIIKSN